MFRRKSIPETQLRRDRPRGEFPDFLLDRGQIDLTGLMRAKTAQTSSGQPIDTVLLELGLLPEAKLADAMAEYLDLPRVHPRDFPLELPALDNLPVEFLRRSTLLPVEVTGSRIVIATARPFDSAPLTALGYFLGLEPAPVVAVASELRRHLDRLLSSGEPAPPAEQGAETAQDDDIERLKDVAREAPVIRLLNRLIVGAVERRASDIHIEPLEDQVQVRLRIDGALQVTESLPKQLQAGLVTRIKILARLNIAEQRLPQDGRIRIPVHGRDIDLRVSSAPVLHGESIALRILDRQELPLDFAALGYKPADVAKIGRLIAEPNGIVLVTGPTGSGKTTTLYAALTQLNRPEAKLFSVEDPVEYHLKGVNQVHVRPQIGLDFAAALRSILRQDPDIVMIGEIRDLETARIAVQASLTGHLVLATLHTNSAAASVTRLIDIGIDDYMLVSSLRGVVAQRLVRRLCPHCKTEHKPSADMLKRLKVKDGPGKFKQPVGCANCRGTGFQGRTVIAEILECGPDLNDAILRQAPERELVEIGRRRGMETLFESGLGKAAAGETSIDEVLRIVSPPA